MERIKGESAVLVHNIGHHDLYAHLDSGDGPPVFCRVKGIASRAFTKPLLDALEAGDVRLRHDEGIRTRLDPPSPLPWTVAKSRKRLDAFAGAAVGLDQPGVLALCFPLVDAAVECVLSTGCRQLEVILVSAGPRGEDREAGKSTEGVARLMECHLGVRFPGVRVQRLHRDTAAPFSMQDTPEDMRELDARIRSVRRPIVDAYGEDWVRHFSVHLSVNTGTVSTLSSMLEGVRPHRPTLVHISDAYRWPVDEAGTPALPNVELLDHDHFAQRPSMDASVVKEEAVARAVEEMRRWAEDFRRLRPVRPGEVAGDGTRPDSEYGFWFRKGQKEVLSVLIVRDRTTGVLQAHRAVNLEVSLPTGTLCAERNAIGTAFAAQPDMRRADIEAVAVLSLDAGLGPRLGPCGACTEWLRKVAEVNPDFRVVTFADLDCRRVFVEPIDT